MVYSADPTARAPQTNADDAGYLCGVGDKVREAIQVAIAVWSRE
jgi:hypothetical protein